MFLASVYGEEEDKDQREKLEKCLKKAVEFICKAQTNKKHRKPEGKEVDIGGWGYVSAADGGNFDEGSVTITAAPGALRGRATPASRCRRRTIDKADRLPRSLHDAEGRRHLQLRRRQRRGAQRPGAPADHRRRRRLLVQRRPVQGRPRQEVDQVLQGQHPGRQGPRQPRRVPELLLRPVRLRPRRRPLRRDVPEGRRRSTWLTWSKYKEAMFPYLIDSQDKNTRRVDGGLHRPGLHHVA